jgi:hypothetical protein
VLHIFLRVIERHLRQSNPGADPSARFGAVSFVHQFGAALNRHVHFHCCVIDGVFEGGSNGPVQFRPKQALTPEALAAIATQVRRRVLRWFARSGLLEAADAQDMLGWEHGGFPLDAAVRIAGDDRAGLERLLRDSARPAFALERLTQVDAERVVYRLPKPQPDGRTALSLAPAQSPEVAARSARRPACEQIGHRRAGIATATTGPWRPTRRCAPPVTTGPSCSHGCSRLSRYCAHSAEPNCA